MPFNEFSLNREEAEILRNACKESIQHGLDHEGSRMDVTPSDFPAALQKVRACFVTLHQEGNLRGCIGTLQAHQSLIENAVGNAHNAAFSDPRFEPVRREELSGLELSISVLGDEERIPASSERSLLDQIQPGRDGITLRAGSRVATLLPAVWESIHSPTEFIHLLKKKAGMDVHAWPDDLTFYRYRTEAY